MQPSNDLPQTEPSARQERLLRPITLEDEDFIQDIESHAQVEEKLQDEEGDWDDILTNSIA